MTAGFAKHFKQEMHLKGAEKKRDGEKPSASPVSGGKFGVGAAAAAAAAHSVAPTFAFGFGNVGRGTSCSASRTARIEMNCSLGVTMVSHRRHGNYANTAFPEEAGALKPITIIIIVMVESSCSGEAAGRWEIPPFSKTDLSGCNTSHAFVCIFYNHESTAMALDL